jgi:hypothetical protein
MGSGRAVLRRLQAVGGLLVVVLLPKTASWNGAARRSRKIRPRRRADAQFQPNKEHASILENLGPDPKRAGIRAAASVGNSRERKRGFEGAELMHKKPVAIYGQSFCGEVER